MALDKDGNVIPAFRPDNPDMYGGGRMTNFIATVERAYLEPRRGKDNPKHFLFGCMDLVDVMMKDGSEHEPMTRRWFAGYFTSQFGQGTFPSVDGVSPVGGSEDDYRALANGEAAIPEGEEENYRGTLTCGNKVSPSAEWTQLLNSIMKAPVDGQDGPWTGWGLDSTCLAGLRVEFVLVPREGGAKSKSKDGEERDTLVVARVLSAPTGTTVVSMAPTAKTATTATTTAAKASVSIAGKPAVTTAATASANGNALLDNEMANHLFIELTVAPGQTLTLLQAAQSVQKLYAGNHKSMQYGVPRVGSPAFHEGRLWSYDPAKRTLSLAAG